MRLRKKQKIFAVCALSAVALLGISACALIDAPTKSILKAAALPESVTINQITYNKITSLSNLTNGKYVMKFDAGYIGSFGSEKFSIGDDASPLEFTFTQTSEGTYNIQNSATEKYYYVNNSNNLTESVGVPSNEWTISFNNDRAKILGHGRFLSKNGNNIKAYSTQNVGKFEMPALYKKHEVLRTVTFETGEGTAIEPIEYADGAEISEAPSTILEGYKVVAWHEKVDGVESQDPITFPYKVTKDVTLVAKWEISNDRTATFHTNTPEVADYEVVFNKGETIIDTTDLTKNGYKFDGWYESPTFEGSKFNFELPQENNVELYAKWVSLDITNIADLVNKETFRIKGEYVGNTHSDEIVIADATGCVPVAFGSVSTFESTGLVLGDLVEITGRASLYDGKYTLKDPQMEDIKIVESDGAITTSALLSTEADVKTDNEGKTIELKKIKVTQELKDKKNGKVGNTTIYGAYSTMSQDEVLSVGDVVNVKGVVAIHSKKAQINISTVEKLQTYSLTYKNGASTELTENYLVDEVTKEPELTPIKEHSNPEVYKYEFAGWTTDEEGLLPFTFGEVLTGNTTLYAKFNEVKIPISERFAGTTVKAGVAFDYTKSVKEGSELVTLDTSNINNYKGGGNQDGFVWDDGYDVNNPAAFKIQSGKAELRINLGGVASDEIILSSSAYAFSGNSNYEAYVSMYNAQNELVGEQGIISFKALANKEIVTCEDVLLDATGLNVTYLKVTSKSGANFGLVSPTVLANVTKETTTYKDFRNVSLAYAYNFKYFEEEGVTNSGLLVTTDLETLTTAKSTKVLPKDDELTHTYSKSYVGPSAGEPLEQFVTYVTFEGNSYIEYSGVTFYAIPFVTVGEEVIYGTEMSTTLEDEILLLNENPEMKVITDALLSELLA